MSDEDCTAFVEMDTQNVVVCVTHDPPVKNHKKWFVTGSDRANLFPVTDDNRVDFFTEGAKLFTQMGNDLDLAAAGGGEVLMTNFEFNLDFTLGSKTMRQHFTALDAAGVQVRLLLNEHFAISVPGFAPITFKPSNQPATDFVDALANGEAIHDGKLLNLGGHHQKILSISTSVPDQSFFFGYCGGFDPSPPRDQASWLDCHCRIDGPAAHDLHNTFVERWNDQASDLSKTPLATTSGSFASDPKRDKTVQIVHTYGNRAPDYGFAPGGVDTLRQLLINAIDRCKRFIYMEDQYLVSEEISQLLAQKLPVLKALVIFVTSSQSANASISQANRRRKLFLDPIMAVDAKKVTVCQPKIPSHYVHSKCWIFDDELAVIGSANCNRRGYTHDSEVAAAISDANTNGNRLIFAHELRMTLWAKHLAVGVNAVRDPIAAAPLWRLPANTRVQPYDPNVGVDGPHPTLGGAALTDAFWDRVVDPDGS